MSGNKQRQASSIDFNRGSTKSNLTRTGTTLNATFRSETEDDISDNSFDLEFDFANSLYLRTLITNKMIEEKVTKNYGDMSDQLAQQIEVLHDLESKKLNLEMEVKRLELNVEVKEVYKRLNEIFCEVTKMLDDYSVDDNLSECIKVGEESAYSKLYLKNIKPLENSDQYDKFLSVVKDCVNSLGMLQNVTCNATEVQLLRDNVKNYQDLQAELISKRQLLTERQNDITFNAFKTLSDKFAAIHQ